MSDDEERKTQRARVVPSWDGKNLEALTRFIPRPSFQTHSHFPCLRCLIFQVQQLLPLQASLPPSPLQTMLLLEERDYIGLSEASSSSSPVKDDVLQSLHDTDLRLDLGLALGLSSDCKEPAAQKGSKFLKKRSYLEVADDGRVSWHPDPLSSDSSSQSSATHDPSPPKAQVVGWPPVCSYRRQTLPKPAEMFVKVNMDGMTVGRKVDLSAYSSYESLLRALEEMFQPSSSRLDSDLRHFLQANNPDFILTYEDKEGDWMLVGDVPWSMFTTVVRRLRITRVSEANGTTVASRRRTLKSKF